MEMTGSSEKVAMTPDGRRKLIAATVASAIASAGIGAVIRDFRARKERDKAMNPEESKNAIVIPIKKSKFLEGVETPEERKVRLSEKSVGIGPEINMSSTADKDIAAMKRDMLRSGRRPDFFRAKAASDSGCAGKCKDDDVNEAASYGSKVGKESKSEDSKGRVILRDQSGKFVIHTDPVSVEQVEKSAQGISDFFYHPIDSTVEAVGRAAKATKDPAVYTLGAVASLYLAAKISDAINARRRKNAKDALEDARDEYVDLLEGGRKYAEADDGLPEMAGKVLGGAFLIPMALTAMVTSKIIENRKNDKKKQKEMSNSYPDEPIILYKTSEDEEIPMSPESALAVIAIKQAMIESGEHDELELNKMSKAAQSSPGRAQQWGDGIRKLFNDMIPLEYQKLLTPEVQEMFGHPRISRMGPGDIKRLMSGARSPMDTQEASRELVRMLSDPNNESNSLAIMRRLIPADGGKPNGNFSVGVNEFLDMSNGMDPETLGRLAVTLADPKRRLEVMNAMRSDKGLQDQFVKWYTDDKYANTFGKHREDIVSGKLDSFGIKKGGMLHDILSWIINNLGIGKYLFKNNINSMFDGWRSANKTNAGNASSTADKPQLAPHTQTQPTTHTTMQTSKSNMPPMPKYGPTIQNAEKLKQEDAPQGGNVPTLATVNPKTAKPVKQDTGNRPKNPAMENIKRMSPLWYKWMLH